MAIDFIPSYVKGFKRGELILIGVSGGFGIILFFLNIFLVARYEGAASSAVNIIVVLAIAFPFALMQYKRYRMSKDIERKFPDFMRNIVEGIRGGMSLPLAINYAARSDYGALTPHVNRIVAQISWGVPFEKALANFTESARSLTINRAVSTIIETHRSGGNIAEVLDSITKSIIELEKIRNERESRIYSQMLQGYIIFFVFIAIMVGIQRFLLPSLQWGQTSITGTDVIEATKTAELTSLYAVRFKHLATLQGFFSGLSIGKLAEGTISGGLKHALILGSIGYIALFGSTLI